MNQESVLNEEALAAYSLLTNGTGPWSSELFRKLRYRADGQKVLKATIFKM
jgi:hypothetical protein